MALKVGELYATMRLDDGQYTQGVRDAKGKLEGLRSAVASGTKVIATAFAATATAVTGIGLAALKVGLDYNRMQQSSRAALTTLLGSAEAANAQMDKLDEFARSSPFAKQVFIQAQQQLIGFGMAAEDVLPTLDAIQNAVAAVGGSNDDISEITRILATVTSSGKITAETLNQLGVRGVDAATLIGNTLGKSGQEIRESITAGSLDAGVAVQALTDGMMARFGGATDNIKAQMDGAADRIKGAFRDIGSVLAAPFIDPQGGGYLVGWANDVADAMRSLEAKLKPLVDLLVVRFGPGLQKVTPTLEAVRGLINSWDISKVNTQLDRLTKYTPLIAGVSTALFTLGSGSLPILRNLGFGAINPLVTGIAALVATSPALRSAFTDAAAAAGPLVPMLGALGVSLSDTAVTVLDSLAPALRDLLVAGADLTVTLGGSLIPAVGSLASSLAPLAEVLADVLGWVADVPAPVLVAGLAFLALREPIGGLVTTVSGPLKAAFGSMREFMDASRAVAEATGGQVSTLGASMQAAKVAAGQLGTAMKTAFMSSAIGLAITGIVTALTAFATAAAEARARANSYAQAMKLVGEEADRAAVEVAKMNLVTGDNADWGWWQRLVTGAESAADAIVGLGFDLDEVAAKIVASDEEYSAFIGSLREMHAAMVANNEGTTQQRDSLLEMIAKVEQQREALGRARHMQEQMGTATASTTGEIRTQADALQVLVDRQREAADQTLSLREAQIRAEESQIRLNERVAEAIALNGDAEASEDQKAAAMRAVESAQIDVTRQYWNVIAAMERNNVSAAELDATIREQREAFIEATVAAGANRIEANNLAAAYGLIPNRVETELIAEAAAAQRAIEQFIETNTDRVIKMRVEANGTVSFNYGGPMSAVHDGALMEFYASGGIRRLTPMAAVAQMVPANTWRVVGDRSDVPEAYIPLNGSARSLAILDEAAARLGRITIPGGALPPRAAGGAPTPAAPVAPRPPAGVSIEVGQIVAADPRAAVRAMYDETAWELARTGVS